MTYPQAHDGCTCECHSCHGVMHCVPCCGPDAPAVEPSTPEQDEQLRKFIESRAVSADTLKQLESRGYDAWMQLALQEGPTQASEMEVADASLMLPQSREAYTRGWERAKSEWAANPFRQKGYDAWLELWTAYSSTPTASQCPARYMKDGLDKTAFIKGWNQALNEFKGKP